MVLKNSSGHRALAREIGSYYSIAGTRLKIWLFVARCGGGIPEMLKDHKTHFPQRTKTLQQSSRLALVQSLHSKFMQLWVFEMFASNKFLCQMF